MAVGIPPLHHVMGRAWLRLLARWTGSLSISRLINHDYNTRIPHTTCYHARSQYGNYSVLNDCGMTQSWHIMIRTCLTQLNDATTESAIQANLLQDYVPDILQSGWCHYYIDGEMYVLCNLKVSLDSCNFPVFFKLRSNRLVLFNLNETLWQV